MPVKPAKSAPISLRVNGEFVEFQPEMTIHDLLESMKLEKSIVAVELNKAVRSKAEYKDIVLQNEDQLEIVSLAGGG